MNQETRTCQNCSQPFTIKPEDFAFYEKIKVPAPTWCPECRMIRRMLFENERQLFRHKDEISGKDIFSEFPPQVQAKIYNDEYWQSDAWDPMDYGREYDFSRPFFEQFKTLMYDVPWVSRSVINLINSDYVHGASNLKDCYLCFNLGSCERCAYVSDANNMKDSLDCTTLARNEFCYECTSVVDSYQTRFSNRCEKCHDVWFSRDCMGCSNCFGCANLRNKQYYIFNRPYSREDYFAKLDQFGLGSHQSLEEIKKQVRQFSLSLPCKFMAGVHNVNVSGDMITSGKNVHESFNVADAENVKYSQGVVLGVYDSYDFTIWGEHSELMYEVLVSGSGCSSLKFTMDCWPADRGIEYSFKCMSSNNLFGCVGLRKKSYCIFNKQYTQEEYFVLRDKIIRHMNEMPFTDQQGRVYRYGEFFPPEFSPFAYNETLANDFFPLTKEEAIRKKYVWREPETREFKTTVDAQNLPDHINDIGDDILKEVIKCASCNKAFRLIPMELEFYRRMTLPIPRICHNCRFIERTKYRNQPKFYQRTCQCAGQQSYNAAYQNQGAHPHGTAACANAFLTSYAPDRKEIIYCEQCYQEEIL
ncbi:MAG: hypothetical protein HY617_03805 [Candidatus Sungbacteria bacterium]|nr:hypothetical protein [Candidatus Sungbacteria bacterium]